MKSDYKMRALVSWVITAALLLGMVTYGPVDAYADDHATSGKCGDWLEWSYENGTLSISGRGDMYNYQSELDGAPWENYKNEITSLVLNQGVTSIGSSAFSYCDKLTNVDIPFGMERIGSYAFYGCTAIESVTFPYAMTATLKEIGICTFYGLSNLSEFKFPSSVESIGYAAFSGCTSLKSIDIPQNVTYIGENPFKGCSALETINVSDYNETYTDENECNAIIREGVLISGCQNTVIPEDVYEIADSAFYGCSGLKEVKLRGHNNNYEGGIERIGASAFYGCSGLTNLEIPDTAQVIEPGAFAGCGNLESIKVSELNQNYTDCDGSNVIVEWKYYNWDMDRYECCLHLGCKNTKAIPEKYKIDTIGWGAFENCAGLTEYVIPNTVSTVGGNAFYGCTGLISVTLPNSVTWIAGSTFRGCSSLQEISIPDSVTNLGYELFYGCSSLSKVTLPSDITEIGEHMFNGCTSLTSIRLPGSVKYIEAWAFAGCSALKGIFIPASVEDIDYGVFENCNNLKDVYYKGSSSQWEEVSISSGNEPLEAATIHFNSDGSDMNKPSADVPTETPSVTPKEESPAPSNPVPSIPVGSVAKDNNGNQVKVTSDTAKTVAFTKANNKKSIRVPATVTINGEIYKVTQINANAFKAGKIRTVTIGKNVKAFKKNAFKGSAVTKLILKTRLLKKSTVKGALAGSKVKTVQVKVGSGSVNKKFVKSYKKIFTKSVAGAKVTVK